MIRLNEYINNSISNNDILLTESKFWKGVLTKFGFGAKTLKNFIKAVRNLPDDVQRYYTLGQYLAARSNDPKLKKFAKEESESIIKGKDNYYKFLKNSVEDILSDFDKRVADNPEHVLYIRDQLKELSDINNDKEGKELSEKISAEMVKKFGKNSEEQKNYETAKEKVEKSGQADILINGGNNEQNNEVVDQAKDDATDVIKDHKTLFMELAKIANINGERLRDYVAKNILTKNEKGQQKSKEELSKITEEEILATCIIVCGAKLTKNADTFNRIAKALGNSKNGLEESMKMIEK